MCVRVGGGVGWEGGEVAEFGERGAGGRKEVELGGPGFAFGFLFGCPFGLKGASQPFSYQLSLWLFLYLSVPIAFP